MLNYQMRLTDLAGNPVADGNNSIYLTFYDDPTTGSQLYSACTTDGNPLSTPTPVTAAFLGGTSTIVIGDTVGLDCTTGGGTAVPMPADLFNNPVIYLGVTVNGDAEMSPRKHIVAAGYAMNSDRLDDLETSNAGGATAFVPVTDSSGNFTLTKDVTFDTSTFVLDSAGNKVGVGTAAPSALFSVGSGSEFQVDGSGNVSTSGTVTLGSQSSDPSGTNGAMYYNTTTNKFRCYQNGAWSNCITTGSGLSIGDSIASSTPGSVLFVDGSNQLAQDNANFFWDTTNFRLGIGNNAPTAALSVGAGANFNVNTTGDATTAFTTLDGASTAANSGTASTSLDVQTGDGTNFDVGNYVEVASATCVSNPCYAKITAVAGDTITISPALDWSSTDVVTEVHVPEVGANDTSSTLANRFGRGYFIDGIVTGNGSTYYTDGKIESIGPIAINATSGQAVTFGGSVTATGPIISTSSSNNELSGPLKFANLSSDPSGTNGLMYYNTGSNKFRCYENGAWKDCDSASTAISIGNAVTSGTAGSVLFVDGSGNLGQDNSNFYWDDSTNRLGLGTTSPASNLHIVGSTDPVQATIDAYGNSVAANWTARRARGSIGTPTAVNANDTLFTFNAKGYNGTAFTSNSNAAIIMKAGENFSGSANGTYITFETTTNGTTSRTERLRIADTGDLTATGDLALNGGDLTTSQTTAALFNTTATTLSIGGAATSLSLGAATGTATIGNPTFTLTNGTAFNINGANPTLAGTSSGTLTLFNTNLTTVNAFGAATALSLGASTGTFTVANPTVTLSNATALNLNGSNPSIATSSSGTANVFNTNATAVNIGGAAGSGGVNIAGGSGSTGCSIDGSNGNLLCSGTISGAGGSAVKTYTYVVAATGGDYTTLGAAVAACPSTGCSIWVKDGTYTETATITIPYSKIQIFLSAGATIQADGASVSPLIAMTSGIGNVTITGGRWLNTNGSAVGTALDMSNAAYTWVSKVSIENWNLAVLYQDTANTTFYNSLTDARLFDNNSCVEYSGTEANANHMIDVRCRPKAGGGGTGLNLVDARGLTVVGSDFEPSSPTGITGVHIDGTSQNISLLNSWIEGNATGLLIDSGANRVTVEGSTISSNTTDITDNGTATAFINARNSNGLVGKQTMNVANGLGGNGITLTQNDTTNNGKGISVTNAGTGNGIYIDQNGDTGSLAASSGALLIDNTGNPGIGANFYSNAGSGQSVSVVFMKQDNSAADKPVLRVDNDGTATGVQINNTGTGAALTLTPTGNTSTSTSIGGTLLVNNTSNLGSGITVYSNAGASTSGANLLSLRADNTAYDQKVMSISNDGSGTSLDINASGGTGGGISVTADGTGHTITATYTGSTASVAAGNFVSTSNAFTAFEVTGHETSHGTIKASHVYDGVTPDTNAAVLSLDRQGAGTAAQGIFIDSTVSGGSTGKILNLRNDGTEYLTLTYKGLLGLSNVTPSELLDVDGGARIGSAPTTLTQLNGAITNSATTITVDDTTSYPQSGTLIIDNEAMTYTGTTGTTFTGVTRAALGTTAAAHDDNTTVNNLLQTVVTSGGATPKLAITGAGYVGIGMASPNEALALADGYSAVINSGHLTTAFAGMGRFENYLTYSEQFNNAAWTKESTITVQTNQDPGPDGTASAERVNAGGASATDGITQAASGAPATATTTWTGSVWLASTSGAKTMALRISSGNETGTPANITIDTSWKRYTVTQAFTAGSTGTATFRIESGTNTGVKLYGAQLELQSGTAKNPYAGTYARTAGTALTTEQRGIFGESAFLDGDLQFQASQTTRNIKIVQETSATNGDGLTLTAGAGGTATGAGTNGGTITLAGGAAAAASSGAGGVGGGVTLSAANGSAAATSGVGGAGGAIALTSGSGASGVSGTSNSGAGGAFTFTSGDGAASAGNGTSGGNAGGFTFTSGTAGSGTSGTSNTGGNGGNFTFTGKAGGAIAASNSTAGTGSSVTFTLGAGGATAGGSPSTGGTGGGFTVNAGNGGASSASTATAGNGGGFTFNGGNGGNNTGTAAGSGAGGVGGALSLNTGVGGNAGSSSQTGTGGASGGLTLSVGFGGTGSPTGNGGAGGALQILGGVGGASGATSGTGGAGSAISITSGTGGPGATNGGAGGALTLTAGNAGTGGNANGGAVTLSSGTLTGSGSNGIIDLKIGGTSKLQLSATGNLVFQANGQIIDMSTTNADGNYGVIKFATSTSCAANTDQGLVFQNGSGTREGHFCWDSGTGMKIYANSTITSGTDLAENYSTKAEADIKPGDVVEIDPSGNLFVRKTGAPYASDIVGVISTEPGLALSGINDSNGGSDTSNPKYLALKGRVPVKVSNENGDIKPGDYLTSSSTPGVAMKATQNGMTIGRALDAFSGATPGVIRVFMEVGWYDADARAAGPKPAGLNIADPLAGDLDLGNHALKNVLEMYGANGLWSIGSDGKMTVAELVTSKVSIRKTDAEKTIGEDKILIGASAAVVTNPSVKESSKVFVTFRKNPRTFWWVDEVHDGSFIVKTDAPAPEDLTFDYWIIDVIDDTTKHADAADSTGSTTDTTTVDTDGDGLSDAQEAQLGTDPNNIDTDGDSYPDGVEVASGHNPLVAETSSAPAVDQPAPDAQTPPTDAGTTDVGSPDTGSTDAAAPADAPSPPDAPAPTEAPAPTTDSTPAQ